MVQVFCTVFHRVNSLLHKTGKKAITPSGPQVDNSKGYHEKEFKISFLLEMLKMEWL